LTEPDPLEFGQCACMSLIFINQCLTLSIQCCRKCSFARPT